MGAVRNLGTSSQLNYGNQRKIDRTQNGALWAITAGNGAGGVTANYSTDNGATWTAVTNPVANGGNSYFGTACLFIDVDDYAHIVYKSPSDGFLYYLRGTPSNAARTAYTWAAPVAENTSTNRDHPDLVVHREGTGWVAHVVSCITHGTNHVGGHALYQRLVIAANGSVTIGNVNSETVLDSTPGANTNAGFPSIDFRHTGDGKTVATVSGIPQPDLFIGWSAGASGSGYGLRFRKAAYASGSWTFAAEREIDPARYYVLGAVGQTFFDGTRVVFAGSIYQPGAGSAVTIVVHDRDVADTTTTLRAYQVQSATASDQSCTWDAVGNVWFVGRDAGVGSQAQTYRKWDRAAQTVGSPTTVDSSTSGANVTSTRRGPGGQAVDFLYVDGTDPYFLVSGRFGLNLNPTAPTPISPADAATWDSSVSNNLVFRHNDPDGDAASAYRISYRPAGTSVAYLQLTGTTTAANGANVTVPIAAGSWVGVIEYFTQTLDTSGAVGAPSPLRTVTAAPADQTGATGGQGGSSLEALDLYTMAQSERTLRTLSLV